MSAAETVPRALVVVAEESEEMEVVIIVDVLRRGGIHVDVAGLDGAAPIVCARGTKLVPDMALADAKGPYEVFILPGGAGGVKRLAASSRVGEILREREAAGRLVAAICAAPAALATHGVYAGRTMTSHPAVKEVVAAHGKLVADRVAEDAALVTSQGPGTAFEFALALMEKLAGREKAAQVAPGLVLPPSIAKSFVLGDNP